MMMVKKTVKKTIYIKKINKKFNYYYYYYPPSPAFSFCSSLS